MAQVINRTQRPALILAPNKTLAAQLYGEFKAFFPKNAVEYFVSYYDYYQPEAYVPRTDTYIEKESNINEQIDRMRHSATRAPLERDDVIIVCPYVHLRHWLGRKLYQYDARIVQGAGNWSLAIAGRSRCLQYRRNDMGFARRFRARRHDRPFPAQYEDRAWRIELFGDEIDTLTEFDPLTGQNPATLSAGVYAPHYVTPRPTLKQAVLHIQDELKFLKSLKRQGGCSKPNVWNNAPCSTLKCWKAPEAARN